MVVARRATVAAAGVKVAKVFAGCTDGLALVFLLNVHVKRVEVQLECRAANRLDQPQPFLARVQKVGLETVERLDANLHALLLGVGGEHLEIFHHERKLLLLILRIDGVRLADHGVNRADERRAAEVHHVVDERLAIFHRLALVLG